MTPTEIGCGTCGHLACVCAIIEGHAKECPYRVMATCRIGIECEHGRDVCPTCDACTCKAPEAAPSGSE